MENLLVIFFLILFFLTIVFAKKNPHTINFLLIAFSIRVIVMILSEYELIYLPDNIGDARKFEAQAKQFSKEYGFLIFKDFFKSDSFLISRIISIFYTIFGESVILAKSISVALGTASVYLTYHLGVLLWDKNSAKKAAWVVALFPSTILYSTLILREVYVVFFLLISLILITKYVKKNSLISFIIIFFNFYVLSLLHGPMVLGFMTFLVYIIFTNLINNINKLYELKIRVNLILYLILLLILFYLYLNSNITIPYLGGISIFSEFFGSVIIKINNYMSSSASYPSWLTIDNKIDFLPKALVKIFYFIYSPFIWDLKKIYHMLGLLDSILFIIFTFYLIQNWKLIWKNPASRIIFLILITYLIIYGISVGNFGTAIRHRSKIIVILIVLAAPKIHRFIFSTKKKNI